MTETGKRANNATISDLGIKNATAHWNLSPEKLANISIEKDVEQEKKERVKNATASKN